MRRDEITFGRRTAHRSRFPFVGADMRLLIAPDARPAEYRI